MTDFSGATLGKYQVIERLGRGGMAEAQPGDKVIIPLICTT